MTSYSIFLTIKDFAKIPSAQEPTDLKLEAEIVSPKIALRSEFIRNDLQLKVGVNL
jgi:hypothetical protein